MQVLLGGRLRPGRGAGVHGPGGRRLRQATRWRWAIAAVLFGPGDAGEPTAQDWADELGTIHYEVVTGVHGARVRRTVVDGDEEIAGRRA